MNAISTVAMALALSVGQSTPGEQPMPSVPPAGSIDLSKLPSGMPGRLRGADGEILVKIKATPIQILKLSNRENEATRKFQEIQSDYRKDKDTARMFERQLEVMKWSRAETKKILGPEKFAAYQKHWDENMKPALDNGKKNPNASIQIADPDDRPTGFQLRPLTSPQDRERFEKQLEDRLKKLKADKNQSAAPESR